MPPVAVVTGASSGIGRAIALRVAREGWRVALAARREDLLDEVAREVERLGGRALVHATDVSQEADVRALAAAVEREWQKVDLVVNAAGVGIGGSVRDMPVAHFDETIAVNLRGPFLVCQALLPLMSRGGSIVNVASVSGLSGSAGLAAYCASKFGLRGLTQSLAAEVSDEGIRAFAINPGYVDTPMVDDAGVPGREMIQVAELADLVWTLVHTGASIQLEDVTVWPQRLYST